MAFFSSTVLAASSDEIQVYDDAINEPGELNVDTHLNYVISGTQQPAYNGEIPAHHDFRMTPEFAYGFTKNWEGGLYVPVIRSANGNWYLEGIKFRLKYLANVPEVGFYWGMNEELGISSHRTDENTWNFEVRPILGYKTENWNLTVNPIIGFTVSGSDHTPDFSPAVKISRKFSDTTWISIEHYSEFPFDIDS